MEEVKHRSLITRGISRIDRFTDVSNTKELTKQEVSLVFEDVSYSIPESFSKQKTLLQGVTGIVKKSEILGILGPSGN